MKALHRAFVDQVCSKNLALFILTFLVFAHSPSPFLSTSLAAQQPKKLEFRIAYVENNGEYEKFYDAKAHLHELFKILAKYTNITPVFVPVSSSDYSKIDSYDKFNVNISAMIAKSPERMFNVKYASIPAAATNIFLATDKNKKINYNDLSELNGKSVAVFLDNNEGKNLLDTFLVKNNISMEYKSYTDYADYLNSNADYHLVNSFYFVRSMQIAAMVGKQDLFFTTLPKYHHLLKALDDALEQARIHDGPALHKLYLKHMSKSTRFVRQQYGEEEQRLLKNPRKVPDIAYSSQHFPVQYTIDKDVPAGISMEVLKLFQEMHDNPSKLISYNFNDAVDLTKFDMLFSIVGHRKLRDTHFYRSESYAQLPMVLFKRKSVATPDKAFKYGMLDYATLEHEQVQKTFPHWEMEIFADLKTMLTAYEDGRIQALFLSKSEAEYVIAQIGIRDNKVLPTSLSLPLYFYLSKAYPPAALNVLNAFVDRLDPTAVQGAILEAENSLRAPVTVPEFIFEHKYILLTLCAVVLCCFCLFYTLKMRFEKRKLRKIINTDALTGLASKECLYACIQRTLKNAMPHEYALISFDIDKFNLLTQVYGKEKADDILRLVGATSLEKFSGDHKAQCIARLRDDVFIVFIKNDNLLSFYEAQDHAVSIIYRAKEILDSNFAMSISRGFYVIDDPTLSVDIMLDYCNMARYEGKLEHGISFVQFTDEMKHKLDVQRHVLCHMEQAIEDQAFHLHFQPKVSLDSLGICGAEVLVRWYQPGENTVLPNDFIEVFENNAFITRLDMYVLEHTCRFIAKYRNRYTLPPLAINLSGISALRIDTLGNIKILLRRYGISPEELEFEITESALVKESAVLTETVNALTRLGHKVAIDDFGTGVSSLHRLSNLQVNVVKLDKAFLDSKLAQKKGIIMVASLISMLHRLNIQVVAEGVETEKHVTILKKMRCNMAQGYYFSRPLDEKTFVSTLHGNFNEDLYDDDDLAFQDGFETSLQISQ